MLILYLDGSVHMTARHWDSLWRSEVSGSGDVVIAAGWMEGIMLHHIIVFRNHV